MEKQMKSNIPATSLKRPQRSQNSSWQYYAVTVVCGAVLVAGFLLAARQHFSSMEYGLQNGKLRRQLEELQSEKRRLLLNREVAVTPIELRKAVKRIGFMDTPSVQADSVKPQNASVQRSVTKTAESGKPADKTGNKVMKTVINSPVIRPPAPDKQARRDTTNQKKDRT